MSATWEVYTIAEAAEVLKVSTQTVQKFIKDKQLKAYRVGHQWRVLDSDLLSFVTAQESNIEEADALEEDNEEKQDNAPEEGDEEEQ